MVYHSPYAHIRKKRASANETERREAMTKALQAIEQVISTTASAATVNARATSKGTVAAKSGKASRMPSGKRTQASHQDLSQRVDLALQEQEAFYHSDDPIAVEARELAESHDKAEVEALIAEKLEAARNAGDKEQFNDALKLRAATHYHRHKRLAAIRSRNWQADTAE